MLDAEFSRFRCEKKDRKNLGMDGRRMGRTRTMIFNENNRHGRVCAYAFRFMDQFV
jgi:hypothetical protein